MLENIKIKKKSKHSLSFNMEFWKKSIVFSFCNILTNNCTFNHRLVKPRSPSHPRVNHWLTEPVRCWTLPNPWLLNPRTQLPTNNILHIVRVCLTPSRDLCQPSGTIFEFELELFLILNIQELQFYELILDPALMSLNSVVHVETCVSHQVRYFNLNFLIRNIQELQFYALLLDPALMSLNSVVHVETCVSHQVRYFNLNLNFFWYAIFKNFNFTHCCLILLWCLWTVWFM